MSTPSDLDSGIFWSLVRRLAGRFSFVIDAVAMWYAMCDEETPWWARCAIAAALVYFVTPIDLIPDALPGGWVDDAGVVSTALTTVRAWVTERHYAQARRALGVGA